ncbi:hypothetical protein BCV70DRAFT_192196 [Testicularia cyperi]|uniref:GYF domain-containing protein n=1 Tax=Testicularia cyperi TaxID=1882483 RepID=A0A317XM42_9BASI|nr:hypothetical protein BCV70DRAFT_192196 [Testicularia cyperi]
MSNHGKRKDPGASGSQPTPSSTATSSKRVRIDDRHNASEVDDLDHFGGDLDLDELEKKRNRRARKASAAASELDAAETSDEDGADGGTYRRKADKSRQADFGDDDHDMFDLDDDDDDTKDVFASKPQAGSRFSQAPVGLDEIGEGQEFGSKKRSALDEDDDAVGLGNSDGDEMDPELELEDSDKEGENSDDAIDLNAQAERTPPTSPGGTPLPKDARRSSFNKGRASQRKKRGPKITGFNMKDEMRTGRFDDEGNYHENSRDPDAQHDAWLTGVYSKSKIRQAKAAHDRRLREAREREAIAQDQDGDEDDVKLKLINYMMRHETVQQTLQRLGKAAAQARKQQTDTKADKATTAPALQAVQDVEAVTHLSSVLMSRFGLLTVYETTYLSLLEDVHRSGLVRRTYDPAARFDSDSASSKTAADSEVAAPSALTNASKRTDTRTDAGPTDLWEYKWAPSYLAAAARASGSPVAPEVEIFGPFSQPDLRSWAQGGYFGDRCDRILLRKAGSKDGWQTYPQAFDAA